MDSLLVVGDESSIIKAVCGVILKGKWKTVLKPKLGSSVTSTVVSQIILKLSPFSLPTACSFFKWVESVPDYKHSPQSNWTMICILTKHKRFKAAHTMLHKIAAKDFLPRPSVLYDVVDVSYDSEVNSEVLSMLVIFYVKSKMTPDAIQVFEHMRFCGFKINLHACNALLNSLAKDRLIDTVWKLFKKMIKSGLVPNLHIYNVLIHACCKSGDVEKAEEVLSEMEFQGIDPNLITYNTLISLYCKKGMHYEAFSLQDRMKQGRVSPDIVTYNSLIYGYCRQGRMREASRLFKEINCAAPNHVTYTTLIDGYCRVNDLDEALHLRKEMEAKGLYPGVATYNSILRKLCQEGQLKDANRLLNEMGEKKIQPDIITCTTLINAYSKIGDMTSAVRVKDRMLTAGLQPDAFTFKALIHGFCNAMKINSAKELLFTMLGAGFCPSYYTYSWLVDAYCNQGDDDAIIKLLDELSERHIFVDISIFRAIIGQLCKREKVDCAEKVYAIMQEKGVLADSVIHINLAYAYLKQGNMIAVSQQLDEMHRRRLRIRPKFFKSFSATYSDQKNTLDVLWCTMLQKGVMSETIYNHIQLQIEALNFKERMLQFHSPVGGEDYNY